MDEATPPEEHPTAAPTERVVETVRVIETPRKGHPFFWGVVSGCLVLFVLFSILGAVIAAMAGEDETSGQWWHTGAQVAVVPIEGEILGSRDVVETLERYANDRSVRAIVVRVNSPGGAIVPSQEIYSAIRRVRAETGKPVVASLDSVAASGGYYIAVACDRIVANPGSITGSIGVIAEWFNVEELLRWARLKPETIVSGSMKDAGSPYRATTEQDRQYLQGIVQELHQQFVGAVAEGRKGKLSRDEIAALADGRVFTGTHAQKLKLIDDLGTLQDAVSTAGKLAGIEGEPDVLYPREREPGLLELLASSESVRSAIDRVLASRSRQFQYRW